MFLLLAMRRSKNILNILSILKYHQTGYKNKPHQILSIQPELDSDVSQALERRLITAEEE